MIPLPDIHDKDYWASIKTWANAPKLKNPSEKNSDGCTGVRDLYVQACWEHDYHYTYARTFYGDPIDRSFADHRFRDVVQMLSVFHQESPLSWWRWVGLRIFGGKAWNDHRREENA